MTITHSHTKQPYQRVGQKKGGNFKTSCWFANTTKPSAGPCGEEKAAGVKFALVVAMGFAKNKVNWLKSGSAHHAAKPWWEAIYNY